MSSGTSMRRRTAGLTWSSVILRRAMVSALMLPSYAPPRALPSDNGNSAARSVCLVIVDAGRAPARSHRRDAVHLDVERAVPRRDADEAARRRVYREIPRVDGVDGREVRRVGAIDVALDDLLERRAGRRQA